MAERRKGVKERTGVGERRVLKAEKNDKCIRKYLTGAKPSSSQHIFKEYVCGQQTL